MAAGLPEGLLWLVGGYLVGSLPWAYWVARRRGLDIRRVGTGIAGTANVARLLGLRAGLAVFGLDAAKGAVPTGLAQALGASPWDVALAGAGAVAGHAWPPWTGFRGGVGLATLLGVTLALMPWALLAAAGPALLLLLRTRNTGHSAGLGLVIALGLAPLLGEPLWEVGTAGGLALGVLVRARLWRPPSTPPGTPPGQPEGR